MSFTERRWVCLLALVSSMQLVADPLSVDYPFATEVSRKHFSQCFPDVSKTDLDKLANITRFAYPEFSPSEPCTLASCAPGLKIFNVTRSISFKASQLNPSVMRSMVYSMEGGDCSYNRIRAFSYSIGRNQITYSYTPFHQERSCNYGFAFDKGDATADVTSTVTLGADFSTTTNTTKSNVRTHSNFSFGNAFADSLIGGLLLGPVGSFVGAVGLPNIVTLLIGDQAFDSYKADINFAKVGINLYAYGNLQKRLDSLGQVTAATPYVTARDLSGFRATGDEISVDVLQKASVLDLVRDDFIATRKVEVDFLANLSEVDAKQYVVKPGDNLWSIVRNEYRDARLFILVAGVNGLKKNEKLPIGRVLMLPRWQEICKQLGGNPEAVLAGESLWSKASKGQIPKTFDSVRTYSGKKSLIFPLEKLQILPK